MNSWQQTNWFVIHSKPCRESVAAEYVGALGPEVFLPQLREERIIRRRRRTVIKPLFAGYLFARFRPSEALEAVRYARGVLAVLSTGRIPIPVDDEIVASVRARCASDGFVRLEAPALRQGDCVEIQEGPFQGWIGQVERECDDGRRVALLLEAVHNARVLVERRSLAAVAA
ncbi:MAG TPA: transcription termination/antitermination NusG family protein [Terrimicrobiaceae bacterium]